MRATSGSTCRAQLTDFEVLYRAHAGYVWTVLSRLGVESVADAHQEVFLTAYRRLDTFDGDRPVRPWLVGIARRVAFRHRRGQQRRSRKRDALAELTHGAHESRGRIEASDFLAQFLEGLTPLRRTIFLRGELEGRTGREIAEALQLSPSTVSSHLRAARAQLRAELLAVEGARPSRAQVDRRFALLAGHLPAVASKPWLATLGAMKLVATAAAVTAAAAVAVTAVPSREGEPPAVVASSDAPTDGEEPERRRNGDAMSASPPPTKDAPDPRAVDPTSSPNPEARPRPTPTPAARPPPDDGECARRLAAARRALKDGRPQAALALLEAHARSFPEGGFDEVRSALRVEVLCALGRTPQARGEARLLLRRYPDSNIARHAMTVCPAAD